MNQALEDIYEKIKHVQIDDVDPLFDDHDSTIADLAKTVSDKLIECEEPISTWQQEHQE